MFKILFLLIYITLTFTLLYRLVTNIILYSNQKKILNEYHEFSSNVLDWVKEIKDLDKRSELFFDLFYVVW